MRTQELNAALNPKPKTLTASETETKELAFKQKQRDAELYTKKAKRAPGGSQKTGVFIGSRGWGLAQGFRFRGFGFSVALVCCMVHLEGFIVYHQGFCFKLEGLLA